MQTHFRLLQMTLFAIPSASFGCRVGCSRALGNFLCQGTLLIGIMVGQGPTALAVCAGGYCLDILSLSCLPHSRRQLDIDQSSTLKTVKPKTTNRPKAFGCITACSIFIPQQKGSGDIATSLAPICLSVHPFTNKNNNFTL